MNKKLDKNKIKKLLEDIDEQSGLPKFLCRKIWTEEQKINNKLKWDILIKKKD